MLAGHGLCCLQDRPPATTHTAAQRTLLRMLPAQLVTGSLRRKPLRLLGHTHGCVREDALCLQPVRGISHLRAAAQQRARQPWHSLLLSAARLQNIVQEMGQMLPGTCRKPDTVAYHIIKVLVLATFCGQSRMMSCIQLYARHMPLLPGKTSPCSCPAAALK